MKHSLRRSTPEEQQISSKAILDFINAVERDELGLHSLMVIRNEHVVAEGWWSPYLPDSVHQLNSVSKSFTSTAIGIAQDEGLLSVNDSVLSFFPEYVTEAIKTNMQNLQIKHLLAMATGHTQDTLPILWGNDSDWVKAFLETPIEKEPGEYFLYNTGASYVLSAILHKVTGIQLLDYLQPRLFDPLGIERTTMETCPQGIQVGGYGMKLKTEDIAKLGLLYLNKGIWKGERILSEHWVTEATKKQVENGEVTDESDWAQGYGYQFWRCRHHAYRADGAFGQFSIVIPHKNVVIAITSGLMEMQDVLDNVWEHLVPGIYDEPIDVDQTSHDELTDKLASLTLLEQFPEKRNISESWMNSGITYQLEPNETPYEQITFSVEGQTTQLVFTGGTTKCMIKMGTNAFVNGELEFTNKTYKYAAQGCWTRKNKLEIFLYLTEYAINDKIICHFVNDSVRISSTRNVWTAPHLSDMAIIPTLVASQFENRDAWVGVTREIDK